jgi:hypothetical protein
LGGISGSLLLLLVRFVPRGLRGIRVDPGRFGLISWLLAEGD